MATVKKATRTAAARPGGGGDMGAEPRVYFVIYDDGTLGRIAIEAPGEAPRLSKPGRTVTEKEYQAALDELRDTTRALVSTLRDEDAARQEAEYADLRAAGIPVTTARRLSGYDGPDEVQR